MKKVNSIFGCFVDMSPAMQEKPAREFSGLILLKLWKNFVSVRYSVASVGGQNLNGVSFLG